MNLCLHKATAWEWKVQEGFIAPVTLDSSSAQTSKWAENGVLSAIVYSTRLHPSTAKSTQMLSCYFHALQIICQQTHVGYGRGEAITLKVSTKAPKNGQHGGLWLFTTSVAQSLGQETFLRCHNARQGTLSQCVVLNGECHLRGQSRMPELGWPVHPTAKPTAVTHVAQYPDETDKGNFV